MNFLNWLREFFVLTITIEMHRGVIRLSPGQGRALPLAPEGSVGER